jgi:hypothetical protein
VSFSSGIVTLLKGVHGPIQPQKGCPPPQKSDWTFSSIFKIPVWPLRIGANGLVARFNRLSVDFIYRQRHS